MIWIIATIFLTIAAIRIDFKIQQRREARFRSSMNAIRELAKDCEAHGVGVTNHL